ncbi:MAG: beta-ketoacyl-ACP reductase [Haloplanus sp.]
MSLEDRTCVVTGASRGIGRGIAEELADHGATVVINYRSSTAEAQATVETIRDRGGSAIKAQADVTDYGAVLEMRDDIHDRTGAVDVLVNNAGITQDVSFARMSPEQWRRVIDVHLNGMFHATKAFFEDIKASESGRLVNISSVVGKQGNFGQANYATAKSGMFGFTRTLALELARHGSTANCIAPGFTKTEMLESVDDDIQDRIREDIPLNRFATVDDLAGVVRFLASEDSSYITGEVIDVNGGIDL